MNHVQAAIDTARATFILVRHDQTRALRYMPILQWQPKARYIPPFAREALRKAGYRVLT